MIERSDPGPAYTSGQTFRARAEARQREYRSQVLKVGWGRYGHFLADDAATEGANFVVPEAFAAAKERRDQGKGVAQRTFDNMLSSQAMCFNLFTPLSLDLDLASKVFQQVLPAVGAVKSITFEYTPPNEVFGDQTGRGGVDCDLLVEAVDKFGAALVLVVETKFVEPEFSTCGFRRAGRQSKGQAVPPRSTDPWLSTGERQEAPSAATIRRTNCHCPVVTSQLAQRDHSCRIGNNSFYAFGTGIN